MARRTRRTILDVTAAEVAQMQAEHNRRMADYDFWRQHKAIRPIKRYAWTAAILIGAAEPAWRLDTRGD